VAFHPCARALRTRRAPERGSFATIIRDRVFLLFFLSGTFSTLVYVAYETLLPISLVDSHGLAPSTWGFLVVVNPVMVTLFQLRLTARTAHVPASLKLSTAILLMGLPFLALTQTGALPVVAAVIFVFVIGEMLWIPTSQAVVARIAPADIRGAYIGAFGSTFAIGFALTPFVGLQVRGAAGDAAMWVMFTSLAVVGAIVGFAACTRAFGLTGAAEGELDEAAVAAAG
jgi:MFS family permease